MNRPRFDAACGAISLRSETSYASLEAGSDFNAIMVVAAEDASTSGTALHAFDAQTPRWPRPGSRGTR